MQDEIDNELARIWQQIDTLQALSASHHQALNEKIPAVAKEFRESIQRLEARVEANFEEDRKTVRKLDRLLSFTGKKLNIAVAGGVGALVGLILLVRIIMIGSGADLVQIASIALGCPAVTSAIGAFTKQSEENNEDG